MEIHPIIKHKKEKPKHKKEKPKQIPTNCNNCENPYIFQDGLCLMYRTPVEHNAADLREFVKIVIKPCLVYAYSRLLFEVYASTLRKLSNVLVNFMSSSLCQALICTILYVPVPILLRLLNSSTLSQERMIKSKARK